MRVFERRVILTTLDPIPRSFRAAPGVLAMNQREVDAVRRNDPEDREVIGEIAEIAQAEDAAEAFQVFKVKPRRVSAKTPKIAPSTRLSMLNSIYKGRI